MSGTVSGTPASLESKKPVEPWARIKPSVDRRQGRPQNPQRKPSALEIYQAQAVARAENQANDGEGREGNRGRGRNVDLARDSLRGQSSVLSSHTCKISLLYV